MIIFLFHLGSALLGLTVTGLLVAKIIMFPDHYKLIERMGMGLVAGTMVLRVGPIMQSPETTPFSDWSTFAMTFGLVLMHWGRLSRLVRHRRNNTRAQDAAIRHLEMRGKL